MNEPADRAADQDHVQADGAHDEPLHAGLAHLQAAALEMIAASRAMLDAAEQVVEDPRAAASIVDLLGSLTAMAKGRASGPGRDPDDPDADPPVQHISVS